MSDSKTEIVYSTNWKIAVYNQVNSYKNLYYVMDGQILNTRYRILQVLCIEETVQTYLVEDITIPEQQFIVKQLHPETKDFQNLTWLRKSFFKEAKILKQLGQEHDKIQKIVAYFAEKREFYIVQELIHGHSLAEEILVGYPLREDQVIDLLLEILDILLFVHNRNIIHQNIQPTNIIRRHLDNKLVLVEFGSLPELVTSIVGNLEYIPIEQLQGQPQYNSDIYALGIIAIAAIMGLTNDEVSILQSEKNLLTGEIIWRDREIKVSRELTQIINKMVRFDYRKRYQSIAEVLNDLQELKNHEYQPQKQHNRQILLMSMGVASGMIFALVGYFFQWIKPGDDEKFLYQEGVSEYDQGNYQEAVDTFTQTIKINSQNPYAYYRRGLAQAQVKEYENAVGDFSQAIALNSNYGLAYYHRGLVYAKLGKEEEALLDFQKAARLFKQQGEQNNYRNAYSEIKSIQK